MLSGPWITQNWKDLEGWAKSRHSAEWRELLVHYAFWVEKNWSTFNSLPQLDKVKLTRTWFKNNSMWTKSDFRKSITVNNLPEEFDGIPDEIQFDFIEIRSEDTSDDIREWMVDVYRNWSERDAIRIIKIREIYLGLPLHQKVLYDMYFSQMMSLREIGAKLNLPHMAVYTMVNDLKKIIKDKCNGI